MKKVILILTAIITLFSWTIVKAEEIPMIQSSNGKI